MKNSLKHMLNIGLAFMALCVFTQGRAAVVPGLPGGDSGGSSAALFQDLKTFLGATNAANIEAAKVLLYMLPPFYDVTLAVTSRIDQGEDAKYSWQEKQLRIMAAYNVMTKKPSDVQLEGARVSFCIDPQGKPAKYCDYTIPHSGNDVLASTLLNTMAYTNEADRLAALQYIKNLTNYVPMDYPGDAAVFQDPKDKSKGLTSPAGVDYFAKAYKVQATLTMAQNALLGIFSDRTRLPNFSAGLPVGDKDGSASVMEMLYYEVSRRYMNQNWYSQMGQSSEAAMLREIANMMALQNYLQLKQYVQGAEIEAMLAAQLSASNQTALQLASQAKPNIDKMVNSANGEGQ